MDKFTAQTDLSVILVSYNTAALLPRAMAALRRAAQGIALRVIIVDNASTDASAELLRREFADCTLIFNEENVGFGRANNQALPYADSRYVLLLNTDAFVAPDTLDKTLAYMDSHPRCGILGVRLVGRDESAQPSAREFPTPWRLFARRVGLRPGDPGDAYARDTCACDWVPGCYYLVRQEVIAAIGLFDPRFFLYYEEVDHCRAARAAGWEVVCYPHTSVVHIGGESARSQGELTPGGRQIEALQIESELLYFRKHYGLAGLLADVFLNVLGDAVLVFKRFLKGRPSHWRPQAQHARRVWALAVATGWGSHPTR